jgi:hypothetical protein
MKLDYSQMLRSVELRYNEHLRSVRAELLRESAELDRELERLDRITENREE